MASEPAHGEALVGLELCAKLARFVRLCDAFHVPLVYLVDLPAGEGAGEQAVPGDSGDVAIMSAVMETVDYTQRATVPKVVLLTGGAYGLAAALLGAVDARSDCVLAWPRATIARSLSAGERAGLSPSDVEEQISVLRAAKAGRVIELNRSAGDAGDAGPHARSVRRGGSLHSAVQAPEHRGMNLGTRGTGRATP